MNETTNIACPFCGHSDIRTINKRKKIFNLSSFRHEYVLRTYIRCNICRAKGPVVSETVPITECKIAYQRLAKLAQRRWCTRRNKIETTD